MRLTELAKKTFKGIAQVEYYVASHYKVHSTIDEWGVYLSICGHEDNENIYDERPCLVLRTSGKGLKRNEIEVCRIASTISNKKDSLQLKDFKSEGLEKPSELRLGYVFKIRKRWLGSKLGDLSERDLEALIWKLR